MAQVNSFSTIDQLAADDVFLFDDDSAGALKNITAEDLFGSLPAFNLIKNYPSIEKAYSASALPLWWNTGLATAYELKTTGNNPNLITIRVDTTSANGYVYQNFLLADEAMLNVGDTVSAGVWIYNADASTTQMFLWDVTNAAVIGSVQSVTAATTWTYVETAGTIASGCTEISFRVRNTAATKTFYIANPVFSYTGICGPFQPRRLVPRWNPHQHLAGVDLGGSSSYSVDLTAGTSNLTALAHVGAHYYNATTANIWIYVDKDSTVPSLPQVDLVRSRTVGTNLRVVHTKVQCSDGQVIYLKPSSAAGDTEVLYLSSNLYWQWEGSAA